MKLKKINKIIDEIELDTIEVLRKKEFVNKKIEIKNLIKLIIMYNLEIKRRLKCEEIIDKIYKE